MRIEYHRTLLADGVRNSAFEAALRELIVPGKTVVADIGAGTGLLGLLASRFGAKDVFLYESGAIADVCASVLKDNDARNCHLFPFNSRDMDDPPRVDLVISETLGNYAFEEDILATMNDAIDRHLKPSGKVVPSGIKQFMAPVVSSKFYDELVVWRQVRSDINFAAAEQLSLNNVYVRAFAATDLLAGLESGVIWDRVHFDVDNDLLRQGEAKWTIETPVKIYGIAVWWSATLVGDIMISTAPGAPATHWEQLYFPIAVPLVLEAGETLAAEIISQSTPEGGTHLAWQVRAIDSAGTLKFEYSHDLDDGYLA